MQDELKACPFCGHPAYDDAETAADFGHRRTGNNFAIACRWCEVSAPGMQTFAEAITAWNTRTDPALAAAQAEVARLREALEDAARQAYRQGHNDGADDVLTQGEKPHSDCITEGFQNYWENARAALVQP